MSRNSTTFKLTLKKLVNLITKSKEFKDVESMVRTLFCQHLVRVSWVRILVLLLLYLKVVEFLLTNKHITHINLYLFLI